VLLRLAGSSFTAGRGNALRRPQNTARESRGEQQRHGDVTALEGTLSALVERHESLRTTFQFRDGRPRQVVTDAVFRGLRLVDLSREADGREQLEDGLREEGLRPYDLSKDVLIRATLFRLAEEEHVLLFVVHHIVPDGRSLRLLFREAATAYEALSAGRAPNPKPLPTQYADYACWQEKWVEGPELERQLAATVSTSSRARPSSASWSPTGPFSRPWPKIPIAPSPPSL